MRLDTKAKRIELQNYFFESLTKKGFTREDYKDLMIWTLTGEKLEYQIFRGTATKPICYYSARSLEAMQKAIDGYKLSADRREAYKAECKSNPSKSTAANAAAAIRVELKENFPDVKFTVKSDNFSMGDSVHVGWTDGPTTDQVNEIIKKYQYGSFDGMTDMYSNTNSRDDIAQSKYVSASRTISDQVNEVVFNALKAKFSEDTPDYTINDDKYRLISKNSIPVGAIVTGIESTGKSGILEDCFRLVLDLTNVKNIKKAAPVQQNSEALEVEPGTVQIIDYSQKAIAVIGETKAIKEGLKNLGGKFNFRLSCGAGWIFSKTKLAEVTAFLSSGVNNEVETVEPEILETVIIPTPETTAFNLESFKILWNEGVQNPDLKNITFTDWNDLQKAFVKIWEENEKGEDCGYTKVGCEIKFLGCEPFMQRLDITNRINSGDFNPSQDHIITYLEIIANQYEVENKNEFEIYNSLEDINEAANGGKLISLLNLSNLVNSKQNNC